MFDEDPWKTINLDEVKIVDSAPNVAGVDDAFNFGDSFRGLFPNKAPNPGASGDQQMMSGMLTILSIAAQVGTNIWTTYKQHEYQLEYMDKAHKQALERWAKENEYNSPAAVKQRLIDAGLNPNLLYGQSGAGMAGSVGNPSAPEAYVTNPSNGVASMLQALQSQALNESQIKVNESIANKNNAEANESKANLGLIAAEIERSGVLNGLTAAEIQKVNSEMAEIEQRIKNMTAEECETWIRAWGKHLDNVYSAESLQDRLNITHDQALSLHADMVYLYRTLDNRVAQTGADLAKTQSEIISMIPALFEAAAFGEYIDYDDDGTPILTDKGREYYRTNLAYKRVGDAVGFVSDLIGGVGRGAVGFGVVSRAFNVDESHTTTTKKTNTGVYETTKTDNYRRKRRPRKR